MPEDTGLAPSCLKDASVAMLSLGGVITMTQAYWATKYRGPQAQGLRFFISRSAQ